MKRKPSTWRAGGGWTRIRVKGRILYQRNGRFTSEDKFNAAVKRRRASQPNWRKISPPDEREEKTTGEFCKLKTREDFYKQVLKDREKFRRKLGEEKSADFQLWFQIGDGKKRRKVSDKRIQYTHGLRKFTSMRKARLFLGIDGIMTSGDKPLPRWTKRGKQGVCQFEKRATLVVSRSTGGRAKRPKILKKYIIQQ
jgi:hypothetical protein